MIEDAAEQQHIGSSTNRSAACGGDRGTAESNNGLRIGLDPRSLVEENTGRPEREVHWLALIGSKAGRQRGDRPDPGAGRQGTVVDRARQVLLPKCQVRAGRDNQIAVSVEGVAHRHECVGAKAAAADEAAKRGRLGLAIRAAGRQVDSIACLGRAADAQRVYARNGQTAVAFEPIGAQRPAQLDGCGNRAGPRLQRLIGP
ncbi:hypothetical protein ES707_06534 [subsurface metagenome]